jgi:hypothetical protein
VLGPLHVQLLCSRQLPSELAAAKQGKRTKAKASSQQPKRRSSGALKGIAARAARTAAALGAAAIAAPAAAAAVEASTEGPYVSTVRVVAAEVFMAC